MTKPSSKIAEAIKDAEDQLRGVVAFQWLFQNEPGYGRPKPTFNLNELRDILRVSGALPTANEKQLIEWATAHMDNGERAMPFAAKFGNIWTFYREDIVLFFGERRWERLAA
jgi:hypothetical protein